MKADYNGSGRFKLPLSLRIAVPVLSFAYVFLPDVIEGFAEGWNYESMGKQVELTRKFERRIEEAERKYVVGGESLEDFAGGVDGKI